MRPGRLSPAFDPEGPFYNYAPCFILYERAIHAFYCANRAPGQVTDSICCRKASRKNSRWIWGEETVALSPGESRSAWDCRHVCDPDVVAGRFRFDGRHWSFALFYLGCDAEDSTHNQVGAAFSQSLDGPWIKYPSPIIHYSTAPDAGVVGARGGWPIWRYWGVGQPAVISLDGRGRVLLFYSRGEETGDEEMAIVDLSDLETGPRIAERRKVSTAGLTRGNRQPANYLTNIGAAYDPHRDRIYMVREGDLPAGDGRFPGFVSAFVQVAWVKGKDLLAGSGRWHVLGNIGVESTGWPRNHNATLLKGPYGHLPHRDHLTIGLSGAEAYDHPPASSAWLWTYRVVLLDLPQKPDPQEA